MLEAICRNSPDEYKPSGKFNVVITEIFELSQSIAVLLEWNENSEQMPITDGECEYISSDFILFCFFHPAKEFTFHIVKDMGMIKVVARRLMAYSTGKNVFALLNLTEVYLI
eukprot:TRINITY_DN178_c0_g2_i11.p4 TRINITY_DN178_c0_g2~~TRINITY_DN178_c0_g2_i11.p4  ORF type:complete len:112 (-),score=14.03 TRINITY_DN178_c0_g2_i11:1670-2005(-)